MDSYQTWQDLLDDEEPAAASGPAGELLPPDSPAAGAVELPQDLLDLMAERDRLQKKLQSMTGQGEPNPEDERTRKLYPVRVHTVESRIEERRMRQRDEQQRVLKQRALERRRIGQLRELREAQRQDDLRRKALEQARIELAAAEQAQVQQRRLRQRAQVLAALATYFTERQEQSQADQAHRLRVAATIQNRWSAQRHRQLVQRIAQRRQQQSQDAQLWHDRREAARRREAQEREVQTWEQARQARDDQRWAYEPGGDRPRQARDQSVLRERPLAEREPTLREPVEREPALRKRLPAEREPPIRERSPAEREAALAKLKHERLQAALAARREEERALEARLDRPRQKREAQRFS